MKTLRTIGTIAWFEMLILFRSWFFRIFSGLIMLVLFVMNLNILGDNHGNWAIKALPSNVPYFNILILSLTQAFIAMFLALDFLKRDKKLDTSEVIYTRSMTNWAYIWGKTLGVMTVFMVLNVMVLLLCLVINLIMSDLGVNWLAYLYYPLIISVPSLIFILGLSFVIMSFFKNQAIALVILLGYTGMVMFFGKDKLDFLFDFMGFRLPMIHSDMAGFGFEGKLLIQRGIYFLLGLSGISGSILLMKRLPQSKWHTSVAWIMTVAFAAAGLAGIVVYTGTTKHDSRFRQEMITLDDQNNKFPSLKLDACDLQVRHEGRTIAVTAGQTLRNGGEETLSTAVFSLNPGMKLKELTVSGARTSFERKDHLVIVNLPQALAPGQSVKAVFTYEGPVDERVCNLDIKEEQFSEKWGPDFLLSIRKRFAMIEPDYVLLTPECAWYPRPGVMHGSTLAVMPPWNFTSFTARIETKKGLTPLMQGKVEQSGEGWTFNPENPLPGMTLIIGRYEVKSLNAAGTDIELSMIRGHDFFSSVLDSVNDTLPRFIGDLKMDLERRLGLKYAYPRLRVIEVPAQFYAYSRLWVKHRDFLQPEMILVPEKGCMLTRSGFAQELRQSISRSKENQESTTEKELQLRVLRNFISDNFMPGSSDNRFMFGPGATPSQALDTDKKFNLFPNFFTFVNHLGSGQYPIINSGIEAYLSNTGDNQMFGFGFSANGLNASEQANQELLKKSFKRLLASDMDNLALRQVIDAKGKYLFTYLEAIAGSPDFTPFILEEIAKSKYKTLEFSQFSEDFNSRFQFNADSLAASWYTTEQLPGYLIGHVRVIEVQQDDRTRYQLLFDVSNPSKESGMIQLTLRGGGRGGMGGRGGGGMPGMRGGASFALAGRNSATDKFLVVPAGKAMQVGYVLDDQPRMMSVNTMISSNLPNNISYPFPKLEQIKGYESFEGMKTIPLILSMSEPGEIVVDNEDTGFSTLGSSSVSRLVKILKINQKDPNIKYESIRSWRPPTVWTPVIQSGFYGDFIRSAVYMKSGEGEQSVRWATLIQKPGYYDVYTYINPNVARMSMRMGSGPGQQRRDGPGGPGGPGNMPEITDEYHFTVFHSEGKEDVTIALKSAETGWNKLGSFYYNADTAKITMNNKNSGRTVVADAVKWVKQQ